MLVPVPPGFLYTLAKDFLGYVRGRRRRLTTAQLVAKREEMRKEIEEKLRENKRRPRREKQRYLCLVSVRAD
jgi:hypothetical protein